jgi:hypothetical protein
MPSGPLLLDVDSGDHRLPREWTEHPAFGQRAVLIESHRYLSRLGAWLIEQLDKVGSEVTGLARQRRILGKIGRSFADLLWGLSSHSRYEEQRLFPFLEACHLSLSFERFDEAHRQLEEVAATVQRCFAAVTQARSEGAVEAMRSQTRDALAGFCALLNEHFIAEEQRVIPLVLELSDEDFSALRAMKASCALPPGGY